MIKYCKNCKYCYWSDYSSYGGDFCCKLLFKLERNFYNTFGVHEKCEDKNINNTCTDYKKKWHKLFLKEE